MIVTNIKVTPQEKLKNLYCTVADCEKCEHKEYCNECKIKPIKESEKNGK